jgi:hypothetical protein
MAIGMYFSPAGMTAANYDVVIKELEAAGAGTPKGRLHHSAFDTPDGFRVYDVWASEEDFNAFGEKLVLILQSQGIEPGQPDAVPLHNLIQ